MQWVALSSPGLINMPISRVFCHGIVFHKAHPNFGLQLLLCTSHINVYKEPYLGGWPNCTHPLESTWHSMGVWTKALEWCDNGGHFGVTRPLSFLRRPWQVWHLIIILHPSSNMRTSRSSFMATHALLIALALWVMPGPHCSCMFYQSSLRGRLEISSWTAVRLIAAREQRTSQEY